MQVIQLYKTPEDNSFSRNPILIGFRVSPYSVKNLETRQRVFVTLQFSDSLKVPNYKNIWEGSLVPDLEGLCSMDISSLIDGALEFFIPNRASYKITLCKKQCGLFRISYYLADASSILSDTTISRSWRVYKGGVAKEDWDLKGTYLNQKIITENKPLHYYDSPETLRINEPKWLYFIAPPLPNTQEVSLNIDLNLASGTTYVNTALTQTGKLIDYAVYCIRIDLESIDVVGNFGADYMEIETATFSLYDNDANNLITSFSCEVDHRPMYDQIYLLYRNSLGGLETIGLMGEKEYGTSITAQSAELLQINDWLGDFRIQAENSDTYSTHNTTNKASTGWISKFQIDRLRDLLLNKEVWLTYGNRLLPVYVSTKNIELYKNRDRLFNLQFEYIQAFENENYSPANLIEFADVCPAVEFFNVEQKYSGYMLITWKLPAGYEDLHVKYKINSGSDISIYFTGNSGSANVDINSTSNSSILIDNVTVDARVVCNGEVSPFSFGPYYTTTFVVPIASILPPIANIDIVDEGPRNTQARILQMGGVDANILANDIAVSNPGLPEFDNFYDAIGVISSVSANGASLSYSGGKITYSPTPTSIGLTAQDFFYYKCKEIIPAYGTMRSNLQMVVVPLKGEIPKVYVKLWATNFTQITKKYGIFNLQSAYDEFADLYFKFYQDAACTIPVDVTFFGISITLQFDENWEEYNNWGGSTGGTGTATAVITTVTACIGYSTQIASQFQLRKFDLGTQQWFDYYSYLQTAGIGNFVFVPGFYYF